ncbi:uncharacterized protein LOC131631198 [Vicia villosa]|uniref:uncharacterized protein LOC131631198 n=1 Tax=Vicia villosa TaxID=3911 RepID=UPI00273BC265|nr:uncharacterized protein LOC131631198 [Vicia villosa]
MNSLFLLAMMKMTKKKKRSSRPLSPSVLAMKKKKNRYFVKSSQQPQQQESLESEFYLPDDCWEHVFSFLINPVDETEDKNKLYFNSLSLVSKRFLSIANRIIFSLTLFYPRLCYLPCFFHRFSNLNSLDLYFCDHDLSPELNADIAFALRDKTTLKSLFIFEIELKDASYVSSHYIDSFVSLKGLNSLRFSDSQISDDLLYSIAREGLPLKTFVLEHCIDYSYPGIYGLLSKCHRIQHLGLQGVHFLNNHHISELSLLLPGMISINLSECSKLTESSLFALIMNCHSLEEIKIEFLYIKSEIVENAHAFRDFDVNPRLKFLHFAGNSFINDEIIILLASIFPNLQLLDLSYCCNISEKSICQVLSRCCKVRHLHLTNCVEVRRIKINFVALQLEVLNLSGTSVNDETLYEISKSCCGLLQLLLISCKYVTEKGVMRVVQKCRQLKKIYLKCCDKVNVDAVISIISSNPSLEIDNCSS